MTAARRPATSRRKSPSKSPSKSSSKSSSRAQGKYTRPALRERLKKKIQAGDKGGKPGQWSARKSQLLAQEYKKEGGGYVGGKGAAQKSLDSWTEEKWQTREGSARARKGGSTSRYLPKKAWASLSESEKTATDTKKRAASRRGKQFVANTAAAKVARKKATRKSAAKRPQRTSSKTSASGSSRTSRPASASRSRGRSR